MRKILKVSKNVKSANFWQIILKKYKKSKKIYFLKKEENLRKKYVGGEKFCLSNKIFHKAKNQIIFKKYLTFSKNLYNSFTFS